LEGLPALPELETATVHGLAVDRGELRVRGKSRRERAVPLSVPVRAVLVSYLNRVRPAALFVGDGCALSRTRRPADHRERGAPGAPTRARSRRCHQEGPPARLPQILRDHYILIFVLIGARSLVLPFVERWWACQQLAPIEGAFVRGC
jgi:hypothetical protein